MEEATVLVLGGGVGGLVCASELRRRLGDNHRVVLIDKEARHVFWPDLLWLAAGTRKPEEFTRDLRRLAKKGIDVVQREVMAIDPACHRVRTETDEWSAKYLVISLGAALAPGAIPGLAEAGHNLYSLEGAKALSADRQRFQAGKQIVLVARTPFKCPAAPYEAVMLLEYDCRKRKVRAQVQMSLFTPEPQPMPVAGPEVGAAISRLLAQREIGYYPGHRVQRVDPERKLIVFESGSEASYDLLAYVPPHEPPPVVQAAGLVGPSGWVPVDTDTMETQFDGVFAIGDVTGIPLPVGLPLPKAGVFAHGEAEVVAHNIACALDGHGQLQRFDGHGECFVEVGDGKAAFGRGNFYASPKPQVKLYGPGRHWHAGKVLFEKDWLRRWF